MKVTFCQPYYQNVWENLGVGYIASYARANFKGRCDFSFFQGMFDKDEEIIADACTSDIFALSCTSPSFAHGVRLARAVRRISPRVRVVVGGWHVTALAHLIEEPSIDQMIVGEGEAAFLEIMNGNRERIVTGRKMCWSELPWPDRKLIRNERTIDLCERQIDVRITSFQSNRVCPFQCVFCAEKIMTGRPNKGSNPIRTRPVRDTIDEIESVTRDFGINFFKFVDATFDISANYVIEFCEEKMRRGNTMEWECLVHAGLANEEMFKYLAKANCKQFNVGCESGSLKVLRQMHKGTTPEITARVFDWGRRAGLQRRGFFLLGMPDETVEDIRDTERLVERIDPDVFGVTILCPYPGSDLYDHERHKDIDWSVTDEYSNDFWRSNHLTNAELKAWQKKLTDRFEHKLAVRQRNPLGYSAAAAI